MGRLLYQIVLVNGRDVMIEADGMEEEDGVYVFTEEEEVVAEFTRNNIAGYCLCGEVEDEEL